MEVVKWMVTTNELSLLTYADVYIDSNDHVASQPHVRAVERLGMSRTLEPTHAG
jgi:hypothetical protein